LDFGHKFGFMPFTYLFYSCRKINFLNCVNT